MAPLIVLLSSFAVFTLFARIRGLDRATIFAGRTALAVMFVFTGVSHFVLTAQMTEMLPAFVPARTAIIWITGALEIGGGIALLVDRTRRLAAYALLAFLVGVFPANVHAAWHQTGPGGHAAGPEYLLFRAPLQILFLAWTYGFCLRDVSDAASRAAPADA